MLFDLDETLIHCVDNCSDPSNYQHLVEIKITKTEKSGNPSNNKTNQQLKVPKRKISGMSNNATITTLVKAGINVRPYAVETLHECEKMGFEVAIFTASH